MTVTELIQLYAPLAGLLAVAFWLGILTQKVRDIKDSLAGLIGEGGVGERLMRIETKMEASDNKLDSLTRSMEGVQRQLGNLMSKGSEFRTGG